jgi:predicted RNase H-like nuclease (RuvC/YqgF family)
VRTRRRKTPTEHNQSITEKDKKERPVTVKTKKLDDSQQVHKLKLQIQTLQHHNQELEKLYSRLQKKYQRLQKKHQKTCFFPQEIS